jgi:high-affinity nickel permease
MEPLLLANAMLLGFRHGFDWDHMAAIFDIVGTFRGKQNCTYVLSEQKTALGLAALYAMGHASVCILLGMLAIFFHMLAPLWLDALMERVVGTTLVLLGVWILISMGRQEESPKSAWMLVLSGLRKTFIQLGKRFGYKHEYAESIECYGPKTAFGIGMIHGIGAETATQVLMIAAVGGAASEFSGALMLLLFVFGLVLSNLILSVLVAGGFLATTLVKRLHLAAAFVAGVFSIVVGSIYFFGAGDILPDIQKAIGYTATVNEVR